MVAYEPVCPFPFDRYPQVVMAHGGGGRLMQCLLEELILPALCVDGAAGMHDAALREPPPGQHLAVTTDSFVIEPLEFPGGDIGALAVYGTVNDLAMAGAMPAWLSVGLILEEGLDLQRLWQLLCSLRRAAEQAGVAIVTGDTKVVQRGRADGLYINTTGIGFCASDVEITPGRIRPGDVLVVNGDIACHGVAVLAEREHLSFDSALESDCMPLAGSVRALLDGGIEVHCLRDLTRGGLAAVAHELARASGMQFVLEEAGIPVGGAVRSACELLGLEPMHVACEGRFIASVPAHQAAACCDVLRTLHPQLPAAVIGRVEQPGSPPVLLHSRIGTMRVIDLPAGELLPRIC